MTSVKAAWVASRVCRLSAVIWVVDLCRACRISGGWPLNKLGVVLRQAQDERGVRRTIARRWATTVRRWVTTVRRWVTTVRRWVTTLTSRLPTVSLRAQRGNLVAVATAVRRRVCNLIEIPARPEPVEGRSQRQTIVGTRERRWLVDARSQAMLTSGTIEAYSARTNGERGSYARRISW